MMYATLVDLSMKDTISHTLHPGVGRFVASDRADNNTQLGIKNDSYVAVSLVEMHICLKNFTSFHIKLL